jgi:hypothetical protein
MRAILIDPFKEEVKEIDLNKDNLLQELYDTIGCTTVERIGITQGADLIIDEEGLFKSGPAFRFGDTMLIHGRAVLVGVNQEEGEWVDSDDPVEIVNDYTMFVPTEFADQAKNAILSGGNLHFIKF